MLRERSCKVQNLKQHLTCVTTSEVSLLTNCASSRGRDRQNGEGTARGLATGETTGEPRGNTGRRGESRRHGSRRADRRAGRRAGRRDGGGADGLESMTVTSVAGSAVARSLNTRPVTKCSTAERESSWGRSRPSSWSARWGSRWSDRGGSGWESRRGPSWGSRWETAREATRRRAGRSGSVSPVGVLERQCQQRTRSIPI